MRRFDARDTELSCGYDTELANRISMLAAAEDFPAGTEGERDPSIDHATYIPLYFIDKFYQDYEVVRIGLSGYGPMEHYHLGQLITQAADQLDRRVVLVASGDLSHKLTYDGPYGFAPEGPVFDEQITEAMDQGDFMRILSFDEGFCDKAAECGLRSFQIMAGALDGKSVDARLLSYEGPFGVGYAVASFIVTGDDDTRRFGARYEDEQRMKVQQARAHEDPYVTLARASVEHFVREGTPLPRPEDLPEEMLTQRAGCLRVPARARPPARLHRHHRPRNAVHRRRDHPQRYLGMQRRPTLRSSTPQRARPARDQRRRAWRAAGHCVNRRARSATLRRHREQWWTPRPCCFPCSTVWIRSPSKSKSPCVRAASAHMSPARRSSASKSSATNKAGVPGTLSHSIGILSVLTNF